MKNRIYVRDNWNCTMSMTRENTKPRKKYPVGIQKFIMQIMLEQIMEILPLYSREKKES